MNYNITVNNCRAFFNVPAKVLKILKLTDPIYCKVLFYILGNDTDIFTSNEISSEINCNESVVDDAIMYWFTNNIITLNGVRNANCETELTTQNPLSVGTQIEPIRNVAQSPVHDESLEKAPPKPQSKKATVKYSPKEIANLVDINSDLRDLFDMVQTSIGRTINYTEQTVFINLLEYYEFSPAVILLVLEYCVQLGKTSPSYVEAVAKDFFSRDITTYQDVEKEIIRLENQRTLEAKISKFFGLETNLTTKQKEYITAWVELNMTYDLICIAYERCIDQINKLSFPYINKIITNWYEKGVTTKSQALSEKLSESQVQKSKSTQQNSTTSYDLDEYEKYTLDFIPKVRGD